MIKSQSLSSTAYVACSWMFFLPCKTITHIMPRNNANEADLWFGTNSNKMTRLTTIIARQPILRVNLRHLKLLSGWDFLTFVLLLKLWPLFLPLRHLTANLMLPLLILISLLILLLRMLLIQRRWALEPLRPEPQSWCKRSPSWLSSPMCPRLWLPDPSAPIRHSLSLHHLCKCRTIP
jgi:hypothetical protein